MSPRRRPRGAPGSAVASLTVRLQKIVPRQSSLERRAPPYPRPRIIAVPESVRIGADRAGSVPVGAGVSVAGVRAGVAGVRRPMKTLAFAMMMTLGITGMAPLSAQPQPPADSGYTASVRNRWNAVKREHLRVRRRRSAGCILCVQADARSTHFRRAARAPHERTLHLLQPDEGREEPARGGRFREKRRRRRSS